MVKGITVVLLIVYAIGGLLHGAEVLAGHATEATVVEVISSVDRSAYRLQTVTDTRPGTGPALELAYPAIGPATTSASRTSRGPAPAVLGQIIITAGTAATFERNLAQPAISTLNRPLNAPRFTIIQGTPAIFDRITTGPNIAARSQPLDVPRFTIIQGTPAIFDRITTGPNIAARSQPLDVPQITIIQGTPAIFDRITTGPNIAARSQPLDVPQITIIQGTPAIFDRITTGPNIAARSQPLDVPQFTIIQGTPATFQRGLFDHLAPDTIVLSAGRGVGLQGTPGESSGAFLRVNGQDHFVGPDGSFSFSATPGPLTIEIKAPSYLSIRVTSPSGPDIVLDAGDVLEMPALTMVYGDADGDGLINGKDISLGTRNFGSTTLTLALTATQQEPPTGDAVIRSVGVGIQGMDDSTGTFLLVDGQRHFVDSNGGSSFTVAPGSHQVQIRAPGYLTVDILSPLGSDIVLNAGDLLIIPQLTMVYGDANGDGAIDVRDLAAGAANFGKASGQLQAAPQ